MALNKDFRTKDSIWVGGSGMFAAKSSSYDGSKIAIDTRGRILSGGRDLVDIFSTFDLADLTAGAGVNTFAYDGRAAKTISLSGASSLINGHLIKWSSTNGFNNSTLTDTSLANLHTTVNGNSAGWESTESTVNTTSAKWGNGWTTVNTNSAGWENNWTITNANSANWNSVYSSYNDISGNTVRYLVANCTEQAAIGWETWGGNTGYCYVYGLGTAASPIFSNVTATTNLSARNVVYAGTGNSSDWQNTYTTVKTNSAKWDNGWTTVNTNSADWENNWTVTNAGSANWNSVYTSYNGASANLIRNIGSDSSQGNVCYTYNTGSKSSFTVCNLGVTDSPTFNNLSVSCNLSVYRNTLLGNEAGDTITICGKASHPNATSSANAVTIGDVALYQGASKQLIVSDDILSLGDATVYGNLSVAGDFTFINTTVTVTSALSVVNKGTGPALYIDQSGVQPIAVFVDYEGGTIIFDNEGKVGIGTSNPAEKLTVSGNISANGTVTFSSLATGTSNSIVIENNGLLQKRAINPDLWNTTADFVSAVPTTTANYVAKFSNSNGVTNSTITDDGTTTTINSNVIVPSAHSIGIATGSGWEMTSYTASVTSGGKSTVITAPKANTTALRYFVSMYTGGALRTAFEVTAVYNGTDVFGDVYSIVDAQATSLLTDVDAVEGTTTIDLEITASEACTVVIHCLRLKSA
jgi:hypothetical protein